VKGTKLWIEAGSPLISGRSRTRRSFNEDWLLAALLALAVAAAVYGVLYARQGGALFGQIRGLLLPAGACVAAVSCLGVWVTRAMGSRRPWLGAGVLAGATALMASGVWRVVGALMTGK
jgi:hypothetical protein